MARGAPADSRFDTAVAVVCAVASLLLLILPDASRARVATAIRGNLLGPVAMLQERAVLAGRALTSHDSLRSAADSVVVRSIQFAAVEEENARLRSLLGLGRALQWGFTPAEVLSGRGTGAEHTLLLSAGAQQGVTRLSAVVAPDGLVGVVEVVDARTSVAIAWPHPSFRVSVSSLDGSAFGIVSAHQGPGADAWLLELHGVPYRSALAQGTVLVSSGLGGVFPRGIVVGTVLQEMETGRGWSRSYLLRPAVQPTDISAVIILAPGRAQAGVDGLWPAQDAGTARGRTTVADSVVTP